MTRRDAWRLQRPLPRVAAVVVAVVAGRLLGTLPFFDPVLALYAGLATAGLVLGTRWATVAGVLLALPPTFQAVRGDTSAAGLAWDVLRWVLFAPLAAYAVARLERYQLEGSGTPVPVLAGFMLGIPLVIGSLMGLPDPRGDRLGALQVLAGGVVLAVAAPIAAGTLDPPGFDAHRRATLSALLALLVFLVPPLSFPYAGVVPPAGSFIPAWGLQVLRATGSALAASALGASLASLVAARYLPPEP